MCWQWVNPGDCLEVSVDVEDGQAPGVGGGGHEQVDNGWPMVLAPVDEVVLNLSDEVPCVVGHRVPGEEPSKKLACLVTVGLAAGGSDQLGLDDRADTDEARPYGVEPDRMDVLTAPEPYHHRGVGQKVHAT